jgi:hypothetical protein
MARLFTLDEAIALLPTVQPILARIMDLRIRLERVERDLLSTHWKARTNGHAAYEDTPGARPAGGAEGGAAPSEPSARSDPGRSRRAELRAALAAELAALDELGVELKDPALGLIDFRSLRDGRVVYLCWRIGEPSIGYWHELDAGFASRKPIWS